jgi:hypothetical protein
MSTTCCAGGFTGFLYDAHSEFTLKMSGKNGMGK